MSLIGINLNKIKLLELEYNEPIKDIILGYRKMNHSWSFIAECLGYSKQGLLKLNKRLGIKDNKIQYSKYHPRTKNGSNLKAQELGFFNMREAIIYFREVGIQLDEIARRLQCSINTVCNYTPEELKYASYHKTHKR